MNIQFFKYEGNGNDFIIIDDRNQIMNENVKLIQKLCNRKLGIGADGLVLIKKDNNYDFYMKYFNANGNEGSMCGNAGRCSVDFFKNFYKKQLYLFNAIDGSHKAYINNKEIIYIQMIDVLKQKIKYNKNFNYILLNTGSPHYVKLSSNIDNIDVYNEGKKIRMKYKYGVNVNFVEIYKNNFLKIRTYERGVEDETLSCGTGVVASVISCHYLNKINKNNIKVITKGGILNVNFENQKNIYNNIWLTGTVNFIFKGFISI